MIVVVIPAYNEGPRLGAVLSRIPECLLRRAVRVVVVSDGSTDETPSVALEHGASLVPLGSNRGKGAALRAGLRRATSFAFDHVVTMDGDGQHDPGDLEGLVLPAVRGWADVVVGSRYLTNPARGGTPLNRYLVRRALIRALRSRGVVSTDPCSGFRCFTREALRRLPLDGDRYQVEVETLLDAAIHGVRVAEVPVARIYGPGLSKMGGEGFRLWGRLAVVSQYVSAVRGKTTELRGSARTAPGGVAAPVAVGDR